MVYWIVSVIGFGFNGDRAGYPMLLWLTAGLVPWFFMSEMISQGMGSLRTYRYLITKMKFPPYRNKSHNKYIEAEFIFTDKAKE